MAPTVRYRFLKNFFIVILFTLKAFAKDLVSCSHRRNIFFSLLKKSVLGLESWYKSYKPTHYLLGYGGYSLETSIHMYITFSMDYNLASHTTYVTLRYNPSVRIIDVVSHTAYDFFLILYISGGNTVKSRTTDLF